MKIMHVDEQIGWRGGEQQASWLVEELANRGHQVAVAGRPGSAFLASDHGGIDVQKFALPMRFEGDISSMRRLGRIVREEKFDIIHAHSSHAHTFACMAKKLAGRGKAIVSRRSSYLPGGSWLNRWKYSWPDHYVPVSERVDSVLREYGIPEHQRTVVYDCIRPDLLDVEPLNRHDLDVDVDENAILILTAGMLVPAKDIDNLLNAIPYVLPHFPHARVLVAGEGPLRSQIERKISALDLEAVVTLLGNRADVANLMHTADLYVSSSWIEGLGTSILEALACGLPIVASDAGGIREMVLDGKTGYLVPIRDPRALGDAIVRSLSDRDRAMTMAQAGIEHINAHFLPVHMVSGMIDVYEKALAEPATVAPG